MKKIYIFLPTVLFTINSMAQTGPGAAPATFNSCSSSCTAASSICPAGSPNTVTNFNDRQYVAGSGSGQTSTGAVWEFYNVATDLSNPAIPLQVNATITVESSYRATLESFDDNSAKDQNNVTLPNMFAPTISADQTLSSTDRSGYIQFKITFYKNTIAGAANKWNIANYTETVALTGLNYVHYDIDGTSASDYQLRETGVVQQVSLSNPGINVNANTELNVYNYTGDGSDWRGFMGSTCNRDNTSRCAEVVAAFKFAGALSTVRFRMGYNYDRISGDGINSRPGRLYASTFGCFTFPQPVFLPVKLLSFTGSFGRTGTDLKWETEAEVNFDHYEIERSNNGTDFTYSGRVAAQSGNSKKEYEYVDNLAAVSGNLFYYRLKMVDIDGKYKFSNVILIRRDGRSINGLTVSPNPISTGAGSTLTMTAVSAGKIEVRVIDMAGKVMLRQQGRVSAGTNSISINNINSLQSGIYTVQLMHNDEIMNTRVSVIK